MKTNEQLTNCLVKLPSPAQLAGSTPAQGLMKTKMITTKIDNKTKRTKAYKITRFGAYEFATVKIDGWWMKLRRRIGNKVFYFYANLRNLDNKKW